MGTAKNIEAYTISPHYSSNTENFINKLAELLNADFIINEYDPEYETIGEINRYTALNKPNQYRLTIEHDEYTIDNETVILPGYELTIPIQHPNERQLQLYFNPNNTVQLTFLTFEHIWQSFVETLKFNRDPKYRIQSIQNYDELRREYRTILTKLQIPSLFMIPDAHYKVNEIENIESYSNPEFSDIPKIAFSLDNIETFHFEPILFAKSKKELPTGFINREVLNIAFIDNLKTESDLI